ncbi:PREDICTED: uncharacterized protein LOC109383718 [Hipposideros armiger]|uniref:Uncharacterized protein LOC109383718 n=1 Tax=Hipposideros armiger TaxID=186990 RepID=A0A8B7RI81_HIPAR|nr:PREDICTED: uncharacterized protein LOC109383718 [Hipposideros armiger]XP_019499934.1 PREDICTED: uncharacterized protein LOC109383718 [Hipposideros armiger]
MALPALKRSERLMRCPEAVAGRPGTQTCISVHREGMWLARGCTALQALAGTPSFLSSHIATSQLPTETVPRSRKDSPFLLAGDPRRLLACSLSSFARLESLVMPRKVLLVNSTSGRQRTLAQEVLGGPLCTRGCHYLSGARATSQRVAPHRWEPRKLTWSQGRHGLLVPGTSPHYSGQPAQHNFFWNMLLSVVLPGASCPPSTAPPPPPAVISMTHKPNILALNFTHQNKDEKNFVDTVLLLSVRPGHVLTTALLSSGAGPLCGSLFLELGVAEVPGARGRMGVTTCQRKEAQKGSGCPALLTA